MNVAAHRPAVRLAAVVLAATASMAGAPGVHAVDVSYHAETVQQARRQGAVSAGEVAWQCEGSRCVGIGPWAVPPVTLCAALAREVGPMRSFAQFPAHEIAACNAAAEGRSPGLAPPRPRPPAKPAPGSGQA